jgi:prolyl oligopeptidase
MGRTEPASKNWIPREGVTMRLGRFALILMILLVTAVAVAEETDPYLWLEEVDGEKALEWVKERGAKDTAELEAVPEFAPIHEKLIEIGVG